MSNVKKKIGIILFALLSLCLVIGCIYYDQSQSTDNLEVIFFDVGQGDSIFIETPNKFQILIDGGDDNQVIYKLGKYMPFYDRTIDLVVVSHPHDDHVMGFAEVLKRYEVEKILITGVDYYTPAYAAFLDEAKKQNISIDIATQDWELDLGDNQRLDVIYPFESIEGVKFENLNNSSIVMQLTFNEINFLFTGDAETEEEHVILSAGIDLQSEVLKAGHHGSDTSSSKEFLEAVNPQQVVISVGEDNSFGHPSLRTINRMKRMDINTFRTDQISDIVLITDGVEVSINY
ncbi:MBL fold metallo-hydrolase [Patescibacteria group bacterium]|nr:MBL fold metallo-hydrolase [Patescibacteria group bacterium]